MKHFHEMIFEGSFGIMPKAVNPCGECTLCCIAPAISKEAGEELGMKPACVACPKVTASGCGIYNNRPSVCRGYECLYSLGYTDTRPDSNGVAWTIQPDLAIPGEVMVIGHALDADAVFQSGAALRFMRRAVRACMFSAIVIRSDKKVIRIDAIGKHDDLEAPIDQNDPEKMTVLGEQQQLTKHTLNL